MTTKYWVKREKTIKGWLVYNNLGAEAHFDSRSKARKWATQMNSGATP